MNLCHVIFYYTLNFMYYNVKKDGTTMNDVYYYNYTAHDAFILSYTLNCYNKSQTADTYHRYHL